MPINLMKDTEKSVWWLQELLDILRMDAYVVDNTRKLEKANMLLLEFSSCYHLDHTIRLIRDHIEKADFSDVPRVHTGTFNYETNKWSDE